MTDESTSSATIPDEGLSLLDDNLATRPMRHRATLKYFEDYMKQGNIISELK